MCYIVAKNFEKVGSIAFKTKHGKELADFIEQLEDKVGYDRIQLITISRPAAYGEYEPYRFVHSEQEFKNAVLAM